MMSLLLFFARLNCYLQGRRSSTHVTALPLHSAADLTSNDEADDYDPAVANDLSYEDAILDLEIHSFMQAEYGHVDPPPGVFFRLKKAIEFGFSSARPQSQSNFWSAFLTQMHNTLSGPIAGRLVPGAVAFAFLVMVMSSSTNLILRGDNERFLLQSYPTSSVTPTTQPDGSQPEHATTTDVASIAGLVLPIKDESQFYDMVERHMSPKHSDGDKTNTQDSQSQNVLLERTKYGAE